MSKHSAFVILGILFSILSYAQNGARISGIVVDENNKGLTAATVSLLNKKDSSLTKVALSDKSGQFEFDALQEGSYFLSISSVGYEKFKSDVYVLSGAQSLQTGSHKLAPASKSLGGVTVESKRPFIESKIDKTVVNVDASPTNAGSTAMDVLEKSPGISVSNDGVISLRGKSGVIVMMDGKPTFLSPTDLANMLKNMPSSALDQIEIMTNPSAKYDASGNSGVINIKTKKGKADGFNGNFMVGATTSIYTYDDELYFRPRSQNSFNFNYRKNKVNFFGNYNPNLFRGRNTLNLTGTIFNNDGDISGYSASETKFMFGSENHTLKLGMDFFADKKNTFGIVVSGFQFNGHPEPTTTNDLLDEQRQLRARLVSNADNDIKFRNFTGNLNWKHVFDTAGKELTVDLDYVKYKNVSDMVLTTDLFNSSLQFTGRSLLRGHLPADIDILSIKTDYVQPFRKGKLETGFKVSYVSNDNLVNYEFHDGSKWNMDEIRSNHFIYDEQINAAYVNLNQQFKKWTVQGGLRLENTNATGRQMMGPKTTFTRDSTNIFPTAFVSYAADKNNTVTLSYGRRITRPNYQDLNPFVYFLDSLTYRQGNIYLRSQYTHNVELSYTFKSKYIATLNYNNTDDVIAQLPRRDKESNGLKRFMTPDNVAEFRNIGLSLTIPAKFTKWWNANLFTNIYNNHYDGVYDTFMVAMSYTSFMINMTNTFTLGKGLTGEISGFYRHRDLVNFTRMEPVYQLSFGAQKQVLKGKGTVRMNVRDPFAWQTFQGYTRFADIEGTFHARPDIRSVTATFTYRFGKNTTQAPRRRTASSQDEQNRVGTGAQQ